MCKGFKKVVVPTLALLGWGTGGLWTCLWTGGPVAHPTLSLNHRAVEKGVSWELWGKPAQSHLVRQDYNRP